MLTRPVLILLGWLIPCQLALCCELPERRADATDLVVRKPIRGEEWRRSLTLVSRREGTRVRNRPAAIDYESPPGTAVVAVHAGRVVMAEPATGYDNTVVIDHGAGFKTLYAHLDSFAVRRGDCVGSGQVIGRLAATVADDNPVLHFEVTDDGRFLRRLPLLARP
jgi:murein DD-endopeptidase MepM/ murein hydrolase activator NlpD